MALVTVMSAKGAPGATTTAMLLAALWPRPTILVDADPAGGDVALRLPDESGRPLDRERGLLSLLPAARRGLSSDTVLQHVQTALGGQAVLGGLQGPEQSLAVGPLWAVLGNAFAGLPGVDVVVDLGQVHAQSPHLALLEHADVALWVYRPAASSVLHTRRRLDGLTEAFAASTTRAGVVAVAPADAESEVAAAVAALGDEREWLTDYGVVAHDRRAVLMFEGGEVYRPERTLLARSGTALAQRVHADVAAAHPEWATTPPADHDQPVDGPVDGGTDPEQEDGAAGHGAGPTGSGRRRRSVLRRRA